MSRKLQYFLIEEITLPIFEDIFSDVNKALDFLNFEDDLSISNVIKIDKLYGIQVTEYNFMKEEIILFDSLEIADEVYSKFNFIKSVKNTVFKASKEYNIKKDEIQKLLKGRI
jgi:hypothetical protein